MKTFALPVWAKLLLIVCSILVAIVAHACSRKPGVAEFVRHQIYPFSLEIPAGWTLDDPAFTRDLRQEVEKQSTEVYKQFARRDDSPFSRIPYLVSFTDQKSTWSRCILSVMRIEPQDSYLDILESDFDAKTKFGKEHGLITKVLRHEKGTIGNFEAFRVETESRDGSHDLIVGLFDPDMPYQVVQLMLSMKNSSLVEDEKLFAHILSTLKVDFTVRVKLGTQECIIDKNAQRFLVVTERHEPNSGNVVLIFQDPHWDSEAQWALSQGLRVLFFANPHLADKSAFLLEGVPAGAVLDASPLVLSVPSPAPSLGKDVLDSFLINGPIAFDRIDGSSVPLLGTEDKELYEGSADSWLSNESDVWTASVALRNRQIAASVVAARRKYANPMLFVGGMHLLPVDEDLFELGNRHSTMPPAATVLTNRGLIDWLKDAGIGYIYIEPIPSFQCSADPRMLDRYRALMAAQRNQTTDRYVQRIASELNLEDSNSDTGRTQGTTVSPDPASAAGLGNLLSSKGSKDKKAKNQKPNKSGTTGAKADPVDRYDDPVSQVYLSGKDRQKGERALRDADPNLIKEKKNTGRIEWKDPKTKQVRVRYDPKGAHEGAHWDKYAPDGVPIDNAGRPNYDRSIHIPAK